jgi:hypothetical protein
LPSYWRFLSVLPSLPVLRCHRWPRQPHLQTSARTYVELRNATFGKCLDVAGQDNGAKVQQYTCNWTVNQQWHEAPIDSGFFMLQVATSSGSARSDPGL